MTLTSSSSNAGSVVLFISNAISNLLAVSIPVLMV